MWSGMSFFELKTPRDMLDKAEREYMRLQSEFNIDNVFNFFVTANHIKDYLQWANTVNSKILESFLQDQDLKDCRDICNKGKHFSLTSRADPAALILDSALGSTPLNALPLGGNEEWVLISSGREIDVEWLASRVLRKWKDFFQTYGI